MKLATINAYDRMVRLRSAVCCPECRGDIVYCDASYCGDLVLDATMACARCGPVGAVRNTRFIFNENPNFSVGRLETAGGKLEFRSVDIGTFAREPGAKWTWDGHRIWSGEDGASLTFQTDAIGIDMRLLRHNWAGVATIAVDGIDLGTFDLFEADGSMEMSVPIFFGSGKHRVTLKATGDRSEASNAAQVHLCGIDELLMIPATHSSFSQPIINRGNPYSGPWPDLVAAAASNAFILDCGCGDRRYGDSRVVNFEYSPFSLPDAFADGHKLPFKDATFDLILSQAVIEHLYNPFIAVDEIFRVCKPGGTVLAESAFMQPLHAVPYHFFNTTMWGIEKLFEQFVIESTESLGALGDTLSWIYALTELRNKGLGDRVTDLLTIARELDQHISPREMAKFASFVRLKAIKPNA